HGSSKCNIHLRLPCLVCHSQATTSARNAVFVYSTLSDNELWQFKCRSANDSYCHVLATLVNVAELEAAHKTAMRNAAFAVNWGVVKDWSEQDRYNRGISRQQAEDLLK